MIHTFKNDVINLIKGNFKDNSFQFYTVEPSYYFGLTILLNTFTYNPSDKILTHKIDKVFNFNIEPNSHSSTTRTVIYELNGRGVLKRFAEEFFLNRTVVYKENPQVYVRRFTIYFPKTKQAEKYIRKACNLFRDSIQNLRDANFVVKLKPWIYYTIFYNPYSSGFNFINAFLYKEKTYINDTKSLIPFYNTIRSMPNAEIEKALLNHTLFKNKNLKLSGLN